MNRARQIYIYNNDSQWLIVANIYQQVTLKSELVIKTVTTCPAIFRIKFFQFELFTIELSIIEICSIDELLLNFTSFEMLNI